MLSESVLRRMKKEPVGHKSSDLVWEEQREMTNFH